MTEKQPIDPRDFGAAGDGKTDDTAALQAAVDSCTGIDYVSAPGVYRISQTIRLSGNGFTSDGTVGAP